MSVERNVQISRSEITSMDEALSWVVQQYDREFTAANMVSIHVEQILFMRGDEDTWRTQWTAAIRGIVEETP